MPRSSAWRMTFSLSASSSVQSCMVPALPKLMQPTHSLETVMPVLLSLVYSIKCSFLPGRRGRSFLRAFLAKGHALAQHLAGLKVLVGRHLEQHRLQHAVIQFAVLVQHLLVGVGGVDGADDVVKAGGAVEVRCGA